MKPGIRDSALTQESVGRIRQAALVRGLYAIVDDSFSNPVGMAKKIIACGCRVIQFRAKNLSTSDFLKTAREIKKECRRHDALFIVNDRVDIALAGGADGVHLGQRDLPILEARRIIGSGKTIGISTRNMNEALEAERDGADYVGFGPIFRTTTKSDVREPQGLKALEGIKKRLSIPVVAIGGIKESNIREVFGTGADAAALISEIAAAEDTTGVASRLVRIAEECHG